MLRIKDLKDSDKLGKQVTIRGWVYRIRKQKENTFLLIRDDRGGVIQSIFPTRMASHLTIESSIKITGILQKDTRAPEGGYEIIGKNVETFSIANSDFPIGEYQSTELLLDNRHLALRSRRMIEIAKIRSSVLKFARLWFIENDWLEVNAPIIVKSSVEGGSTLFKVRYFEEDAFLSQSSQLYLEAMVFCLGPVWSLGPSFRAEKSRTIRHLAEFSHLEAEAPWIDLLDLLKMQEELVSYIIQNTIRERSESLAFLKRDVEELRKVEPPFERISYKKAIEILRSKQFVVSENETTRMIRLGEDLNIDSERELTKHVNKPIFVTGYPLGIKPFYVKEDRTNTGIGLTADLLAPIGFGEISSGGIREDDIVLLKKRIENEGLELNNYDWYLDLRRYGSIPHGGFGIGIERLVRWISNIDDIKDTVLFPRTLSRATP
jgi:asparaginyl-tRNA synthetase